MRFLPLLLCLAFGQAWAATYHLCPDTDASNVDLNYGAEDGSSEANCYDGFVDAATTAVATSGDVIVLHGTFYNERGYAWASGASGAQLYFVCGTDCTFWYSVSVAGNYTVAGSPYGQTTGSSWQLVSGTTDIWKKGVGSTPFMMWVDGMRMPNAPTIPATNDDAGALAAITAAGQFTVTSASLDGFARTLYYKGAPTSSMRVNNQSLYTAANSMGGFVVNGKNYVTLVSPKIRGYRPNVNEVGNLFIQGCTGCVVTDLKAWEGMTALKMQNNTTLQVSGRSCELYSNIAGTAVSVKLYDALTVTGTAFYDNSAIGVTPSTGFLPPTVHIGRAFGTGLTVVVAGTNPMVQLCYL